METYQEKVEFLSQLNESGKRLAWRKDLSLEPELFGRPLRAKGIYLYDRPFAAESRQLASLELDLVLYNETDAMKIKQPEGYDLFRLFDLQEFPYLAAARVPPPSRKWWKPHVD